MSKTIDKRIVRTKNALKDAFLLLCKEKHIDKITIQEITDSAGYSRGAFYRHYNDKKQFLESLVIDEALIFIDYSCVIFSRPFNNYEKALEDSGIALFTNVYIKRQLYRMIFKNIIFEYSMDLFFKTVQDRVTEIFEHSDCSLKDAVNPDLFIYANNSWYFSIINWWIDQNFQLSPEYISSQERLCKYKKLF